MRAGDEPLATMPDQRPGDEARVKKHSEPRDAQVASPWMDADTATAYLGFATRKALYQAVRRGQLPVHRLGRRRMRFHRSELDRVLLNRG